MARIILITGGARSGKSHFAEEICRISGKKVGYIATSEIWDDEMAERVQVHKKRRPASWRTWETPGGDKKILQEACEKSEILLFDCLTLYLTHWIFHPEIPAEDEGKEKFILGKVDELLEIFASWDGTVVFVTNEVGQGIVPNEKISRLFRDFAGKMNVRVADAADEAYLIVAGHALPLKKLAVTSEEVIGAW